MVVDMNHIIPQHFEIKSFEYSPVSYVTTVWSARMGKKRSIKDKGTLCETPVRMGSAASICNSRLSRSFILINLNESEIKSQRVNLVLVFFLLNSADYQ